MYDQKSIECGPNEQNFYEHNESIVKMHKRRLFQRQACLLSVMAAFIIGLSLGVFVPVIGLGTTVLSDEPVTTNNLLQHHHYHRPSDSIRFESSIETTRAENDDKLPVLHDEIYSHQGPDIQFPTIYDIDKKEKLDNKDSYAVTFVTEGKKTNQHFNYNVNRPLSTYDSDNNARSSDGVQKVKTTSSRKKHQQQQQQQPQPQYRIYENKSFLSNFKRNNKISGKKYANQASLLENSDKNDRNILIENNTVTNSTPFNVIEDNIFWGKVIEDTLPNGYTHEHTKDWNQYINSSIVTKLEMGCGRMQNRLVTFKDGKQACARYRQNTDQIQGELFSFYLGQLLNLSNLAPSAASVIDLDSPTWMSASQDIQNAQWKSQRPVVLTHWIPNLEAANIPMPFQPMERHLNKYDVINITLGLDAPKPPKALLDLLTVTRNSNHNQPTRIPLTIETEMNDTIRHKLIELAQWSDLIVFDYLIANLDRVVNNLYNFQWNADIMAAPAHNLARQSDSQLLVFLDNESGLLHGYRLLKKYETYHGLLLDNLCVFRRPTIDALQQLQTDGIGKRLQQLFEHSTTGNVRDILPSLPDKSIKILVDRIDRVLDQVQKCRELFSKR